jgi:exopolysaccharide biosynthesis protein
LHGLDVEIGAGVRARAHLDGGAFALGDRSLSEVRGDVRYDDGKLGSRRVAGKLDAIAFDGAGEVDGLTRNGSWLRDGSNDLRALASLARRIAAEPGVRTAHLEATAPGLAYAQYALATDHGPLAISLISMDPKEPTLHLDTAIAENHVVSGGERTSAMGVRTGAVAGVNGDYFDIGHTYQPQGMLVRAGRLVRGPVDRAALVVDRDKRVRFGEFHLSGSVRTARGTMPVTEFNDWPNGDVAVITADYGKELRSAPGETFVALEPAGAPDRYRVTAVVPGGGVAPAFGIALGHDIKLPPPRVGETITLSYRTDPPLRDAVAAIGGGPMLVRDGRPYEDPHAPAPDERDYRWPVVALAREADDALLLVAVDGRHPERSVGMKRPEFAELLMRFGAVDAMALDSGGSVTLVSRAPGDANVTVRNVPSDDSAERWVSDALFVYSTAAPPAVVPPAVAATPVPETRPSP